MSRSPALKTEMGSKVVWCGPSVVWLNNNFMRSTFLTSYVRRELSLSLRLFDVHSEQCLLCRCQGLFRILTFVFPSAKMMKAVDCARRRMPPGELIPLLYCLITIFYYPLFYLNRSDRLSVYCTSTGNVIQCQLSEVLRWSHIRQKKLWGASCSHGTINGTVQTHALFCDAENVVCSKG